MNWSHTKRRRLHPAALPPPLLRPLMLALAMAACTASTSGGGGVPYVYDAAASGTDAGGADTEQSDGAHVAQPVNFVGFNAGLATNFVPYAPERQAAVIAAVKALDAEVVCLQEVWSDEDTAAVIAGVADTFPHAFHAKTEDDPGAASRPVACTQGDAGKFKECVETNCSANPNDPCSKAPPLTVCSLNKCGLLMPESKKCVDCIAANIGLGVDGVFAACANEGGGQFAFKGRNGLVLLSKVKLTETGHTVLKSSTTRRAVLHAQTDLHGFKTRLFCTHLTAGLASIPYAGEFGSWDKEQGQQVDAVVKLVGDKAGNDAAVLIGDMNCGPGTPTSDPEMENNYKKFTAAGFKAPYADSTNAKCTWCTDNTLHDVVDKKAKGTIIDHILIKNLDNAAAKAKATRVIDGKVEIEVACKKKQVHVSDHYGISVELGPGF